MTARQFIAKYYGIGIVAGVILAWVENPFGQHSYTNAGGRTINCGGWADPTYPMDGQGPCTGILTNTRTWFLVGAALIVASVIGYLATKDDVK